MADRAAGVEDVSVGIGTGDSGGADVDAKGGGEGGTEVAGAGGASSAADGVDTGGSRCPLEPPTRLSSSHIWALMRSYYERQGVEAWNSGSVPYFVTSNAFIARAYARVIRGYVRDLEAQGRLVPDEPLYVFELGAGSGKFGYLLLKALMEAMCRPRGARGARVGCERSRGSCGGFDAATQLRFVMTDFTEANVLYWEQVPCLKPYVEAGLLDFAVLDAGNDATVTLRRSGTVLGPGAAGAAAAAASSTAATGGPTPVPMRNGAIVIANYLFDTLPHDAFQVVGSELREVLLSIGSTRDREPDPLDPEILNRMDNEWTYNVLATRPASSAAMGGGGGGAGAGYYAADAAAGAGAGAAAGQLRSGVAAEAGDVLDRVIEWYHRFFGGDPDGGDGAGDGDRGGSAGDADAADDDGDVRRVSVSSAAFTVPVGALRCLANLHRMCEGGLLVLVGDKGHCSPESFRGAGEPHIAVHGSFSLMVNLHAAGLFVAGHGGFALHTPQEEASLQVSALVMEPAGQAADDAGADVTAGAEGGDDGTSGADGDSDAPSAAAAAAAAAALQTALTGAALEDGGGEADGGDEEANSRARAARVGSALGLPPDGGGEGGARAAAYPWLCEAFTESVVHFGPNDFFLLQRSIKTEGRPQLKNIIALLNLGDWDPDTYWKYRDVVLERVATCGARLRRDLARGMRRMWSHYYPIEPDKDIAFEIARFHYGAGDFAAALRFYRVSADLTGAHAVTAHNMGLCHYALGDLPAAVACFEQSLDLDADYSKSEEWLSRVRVEVAGGAGGAGGSGGSASAAGDEVRLGAERTRLMLDPSVL